MQTEKIMSHREGELNALYVSQEKDWTKIISQSPSSKFFDDHEYQTTLEDAQNDKFLHSYIRDYLTSGDCSLALKNTRVYRNPS